MCFVSFFEELYHKQRGHFPPYNTARSFNLNTFVSEWALKSPLSKLNTLVKSNFAKACNFF